MKIPTISRKIWLVISTLAIVGGFFSFYFLVYMKDKQMDLEAKKFRTLNQYAENIANAYPELTKKKIDSLNNVDSANVAGKVTILKNARRNLWSQISMEADFSELVFQYDSTIESQTFKNNVNDYIVDSILRQGDVSRQGELHVNNKTYIVFIHEFLLKDENLKERTCRLFGFCEKRLFMSQVRSVKLIYVVGASLSLILILLMMPLLKLWIMNELEKLQTINVWFCGFSLVIGSSFLMLILLMSKDYFTSYESFHGDKTHVCPGHDGSRLELLSCEIEKNFIEELRLIYHQLQKSSTQIDSAVKSPIDPTLYGNVLTSSPLELNFYPFFNEMLWIKKTGLPNIIVATHDLKKSDVIKLDARKYFSMALNDSTWIMPDTDDSTQRFALQSIHSYISNNHEAGFGVKLDSSNQFGCAVVLAMATKLNSVMDPLLPPGYQFVIIDNAGKVWFHSKTHKNLKENFFDETGQDGNLRAAVHGRATTSLNVNYNHSSHRGFIRPIKNTDLHLVTLYDQEYFNTPVVLTVGVGSFLILILFLNQGLHQLILLLTTFRFSMLKVNRFFLSWLRPQKEKMMIYRKAIWVQLLIGAILLIFLVNDFSFYVIISFLTLPLYLHVYHYFSLERVRVHKERKEQNRVVWIHPFFLTSFLFIVLLNMSGFYYSTDGNYSLDISIQLLIILLLYGAYSWKPSKKIKRSLLRNRRYLFKSTIGFIKLIISTYHKTSAAPLDREMTPRSMRLEYWHCTFLFLWLILASIMPTYYFYKTANRIEDEIWQRQIQLAAAQSEEQRSLLLNLELQKTFGGLSAEMVKKGNYLEVTKKIKHNSDTTHVKPINRERYHDLMFWGAPHVKGLAEQSRSAIYPKSGDGKWTFYRDRSKKTLVMKYKTDTGKVVYYQSALAPFQMFNGDYWYLLLIAMILCSIVVFRTIRFCVRHIFGLGLLTIDKPEVPVLSNRDRYFIVGVPHSGKSKMIEEIVKKSQITGYIQSINLNAESLPDISVNAKLIIAKDFHLDINSHQSNQEKLKKMEILRRNVDIPVIIMSNLEPAAILEFYEKIATYYQKEKNDYELEGKFRDCKHAYRKWKNLLSGYSILYNPLHKGKHSDNKYINREIGHGDFLPQLKNQLSTHIANSRDQEEMILHVEELAQLYYHALWNCLSSAEKFLLYDLAKDRFVNMRNMKIIRMLRKKGLLVMRNSLHIMNRSFNNFILSIVKEDEEIKMEKEMRKRGSWNTLHLILVITIVSIVIFLGIAEQELFNNVQSIVAATAALLPLLGRFGGIFTSDKVKE